jgi:hypothetical protein
MKYRSSSWSLLKALYDNNNDNDIISSTTHDDDDVDDDDVVQLFITKEELMKLAEVVYGKPMETTHTGLNSPGFGAWSSIKTLEKHNLVIRTRKKKSRKDLFGLTKEGICFCKQLFSSSSSGTNNTKHSSSSISSFLTTTNKTSSNGSSSAKSKDVISIDAKLASTPAASSQTNNKKNFITSFFSIKTKNK